MNAAACSVPHWVILNQTRSSLIKVEANECCWWEGCILLHFSVPTWALNLQTVSWDRYHSHEKICTTPSGNERKQEDLRIICFSIIMTLLKSMHLRHAADGSWVRNDYVEFSMRNHGSNTFESCSKQFVHARDFYFTENGSLWYFRNVISINGKCLALCAAKHFAMFFFVFFTVCKIIFMI